MDILRADLDPSQAMGREKLQQGNEWLGRCQLPEDDDISDLVPKDSLIHPLGNDSPSEDEPGS